MIALRFGFVSLLFYAVLSFAAGRWMVWNFIAWPCVFWLSAVITYTWLARVNRALVDERMQPPNDRDRVTRRLTLLPVWGGLVLAGLDTRYGWTTPALWMELVGLCVVALSFALVAWVLLTNGFASSAVRIQKERGQTVITGGPYAFVRHPMYLATMLVCIASGPALGSWLAGLAFLPVIGLFVWRTLIEDRMLLSELSGYDAYAARVRWRVLPFVF